MKKWNVNWQVKDKIRRIAAMLLSFVLLFDALEISAPAPIVRAMEEGFGAFCTVTGFAELPRELRMQTVPVGAQESEISFPKSLEVTANVLENPDDRNQGSSYGTDGWNAAQLPQNETLAPAEEEILLADDETQGMPQTQPQTQAAPVVSGTDGFSFTIDSVEEVPYTQSTIKLDGVKWRIDKEQSDANTFLSDEEHEGAVYTYIAVLPEKDSKGNTILLQDTAKLPEIRVTVRGRKSENEEIAGAESESETEELTEAERETEAVTEIETETEAVTEKLTETESETETEKVTETESETETEEITETESEAETEEITETASETETEKNTEAETETEKITETESETETEELTEAERETEAITERMTETDAEKETGSDKVVEQEAETELATEEAEAETEELTEAETETETETESEPETESETELESETETEVESESETEEPMFDLMSLGDEPMMMSLTDEQAGPVYNEDGSINLEQYITGVEFTWKDRNGIRWPIEKNAEDKYEFPNDHTLGFTLHYKIPKGVVTRENRKLSYDLPAGFEYSNTSGKIKWGGVDVGDYTINGGRVYLEFYENSSFFDTDTEFTGYITFDSDLKREQSGDGGKLEFNDTVDFTYTITEKKEEGSVTTDSSFNASKSASWLDKDNMMHYTVEVTPGNNGATNVTLKDKLGVQIEGYDYGNMQYGFEFVGFNVVDETGVPLTLMDQNTIHQVGEPTTETKDGRTVTTERYQDESGHGYTKVTDGDTVTITPDAGYYMVEGPQADGTYTFYLPDMLYDKDTPTENKNKKYTIEYNVDLPKWFEGKEGVDIKWDSLNLHNTLTDSHNTTKADLWTSHKNDWIKKSNTEPAELDSTGEKYKMGWKIEINPEHYDLPLDAVFKDTMSMGGVQSWENKNLTITITGKDTSETYTFSGSEYSDLLAELLPGTTATTEMTIGELLTALGRNPEGETTDYTITLEYTTTVDKSALPNGTTTATNSSNLEVGKHTASSSASTGGLQNDKLKKQAVKEDVSFGNVTYREDGSEILKQVLLIPWEATVNMRSSYDNTTLFTASIEDVFGDNLWVTPEYLRGSLKLYLPDGTEISSTDYTLYYKTADDYQSYVPDGSKVTGFKIVFGEDVYGSLAGKKLTLKYTLYGDTEDLYASSKWNTPQVSYNNTIKYANDTFTATYTRKGDYFAKGLYYNYTDFKDNYDVKWEELPDGHLVWRINVELASTSLDDDIIITDEFPADQLTLRSVTLERNGGGSGKTDPLTDFAVGSHTLSFTDGDTTEEITVNVEEIEDGKKIRISITVPKDLTGEGNNSRFDLRVEADIPESSDFWNSDILKVEQSFENSASLTVGSQPSREDKHEVTVTKDTPVMEKTGSFNSGSVMHYELKANPNAKDYYPEKGKMLDLVDILEYDPNIESDGNIIEGAKEVSLVPGSVKAYILDTAGEKVYLPIQGLGFTYKYEEKTVNVDGKLVKRNTLTMQIPDGQTVYVEYDYVLHCNQTLNWNIKNTATLMGKDEYSDADEKNVYYQSSASEVEKITVDFYKVDENNYNITLPGAKFILYEWKAYDDGAGWTKEAAEALKSSNADACVFTADETGCWKAQQVDGDSGEIRYFVSDSKGKLPIEPTTGTLYWLKEIEAPLGYVKPEDNNGYYFYLESSDNKFKDYEKPSNLTEDQVHVLNSANKEYTVYIPNKSDGKISAQKIWADGTTPETVVLTLYQGDGAGYTYEDTISKNGEPAKLTPVLKDDSVYTQTISPEGSQTVTWEGLEQFDTNMDPIYYYVFETQVGGSGKAVLKDGKYYINGYDVEYVNNIGIMAGAVTITNRKTSVSAKKVWSPDATPVEVEFTLYRSTKNGWTDAQLAEWLKGESGSSADSAQLEKVYSATIDAFATEDASVVNWDNLPVADEDGNPYYYYVFETEAGGKRNVQLVGDTYMTGDFKVDYDQKGIEGGTITVTNTATKIGVEKKWAEGIAEENKRDVTMQLYQSFTPPKSPDAGEEEKEIEIYVHSDDVPSGSWPTEDYGGFTYEKRTSVKTTAETIELFWVIEGEGGGGAGYKYSDKIHLPLCNVPNVGVQLISSVDTGNAYNSHCETVWKVSGLTDSCKLYIFVDGSLKVYNQNLEFRVKSESQGSGLQFPQDAKAVEASRRSDAKVTLQSGSWEYTWENLPAVAWDDVEKIFKPVYYYVKEEVPEGYSPKYEYLEYDETSGRYKLVRVTNHPGDEPTDTSIKVVKKWLDADGNAITPGSDWKVDLQLWQKESDGTTSQYPDGSITLPCNGNWEYEWSRLPNDRQYYVVETKGKDNYEVTYESDGKPGSEKPEDAAIAGGTVTVVNTQQSTQVKVDKEWFSASGDQILSPPDDWQVQMKLYQSKTPPTGTENPGTGSGSSSGSGSGTPSGGAKTVILEISKYSNNPYVKASIETDSALVRIAYQKYGLDSELLKAHIKNVSLCSSPEGIYVDNDYTKLVEEATNNTNKYIEFKISGLHSYTSDECRLIFDPAIDESHLFWASNEGHEIVPIPDSTTPAVPPDPVEGDGDGENDENTEEQILPADRVEVPDSTVTLDNTNGWSHTWENLPQYNASGEKLYYYVEEQNTDKYKSTTYEYTYDAEGTPNVTITNTLPDEPLSTTTAVKVTKVWKGYDGKPLGDEEIKGFSVDVQLQRRKKDKNQGDEDGWEDYETSITLNGSEGWTHTWEGLDWKQYDASGKLTCEYEYRVREVKVTDSSNSKVNNFETTYSPNISTSGDYEFTITNTKKRQGITLPETGSKYPWIFYGIGMTFMLIALVWMRRALKKSYIPSDTGKGGRRSDE